MERDQAIFAQNKSGDILYFDGIRQCAKHFNRHMNTIYTAIKKGSVLHTDCGQWFIDYAIEEVYLK